MLYVWKRQDLNAGLGDSKICSKFRVTIFGCWVHKWYLFSSLYSHVFFLIALLRHIHIPTNLKFAVQWFLVYSQGCTPPLLSNFRMLQHSKANHINSNILITTLPITWKLLIFNPIHDGKIMNLPLLDILYKWNHVKEWSFVISFFNLIEKFQKSSMTQHLLILHFFLLMTIIVHYMDISHFLIH